MDCPKGGHLVDTSIEEASTGQPVRECSCGFASSGPHADRSYQDHLNGLI